MPALIATDYIGTLTWLGRVADRGVGLRAARATSLMLGFAGPEGEAHGGLTRPSCSRVVAQYRKGTEIRNVRQLSILSAEEITLIAGKMGLETLDPALLGATAVISGLPDFTHLPPSARLQSGNGATVVVDMENRPCQLPAREIEKDLPGRGGLFKSAAKSLRGVTAWVECEGEWLLGDQITLHVPAQRAWAP